MNHLLFKSERIIRASLLLNYGFRSSIVALDTNLPPHLIRQLYKEVTGKSPNPGPLPEGGSIVKTRRALIESSLLMEIYTNIGGENVYKKIDIDALMKAYDFYLIARGEAGLPPQNPWKRLNINQGWVLAKNLSFNLASLNRCRCGCHYLIVSKQRIQPICPMCEICNEGEMKALFEQ